MPEDITVTAVTNREGVCKTDSRRKAHKSQAAGRLEGRANPRLLWRGRQSHGIGRRHVARYLDILHREHYAGAQAGASGSTNQVWRREVVVPGPTPIQLCFSRPVPQANVSQGQSVDRFEKFDVDSEFSHRFAIPRS